MYENTGQISKFDMDAKMMAAQQRSAGYAGGSLADAPPRPAGVLKCHAMALRECLSSIEGQRNRIYGLTERLLTPHPTPKPSGNKAGDRVHHDTIEGDLEQLIRQANRLLSSFGEIADRLDSAV